MKKQWIGFFTALCMVSAGIFTGCGSAAQSKETAAPAQQTDGEQKGASSAAEPIKVKIAHAGSEQTMMHLAWLEAEKVMEKDGVFEVEIYPNGQLGGDQQLQEAVQQGDITMTACTSASLATFEPSVSVFTIPFLFPDNETAYAVLDGEFGQKMLDKMEDSGFKGLGYFESVSYRELSSNRPIRSPEDLKGLKIRVIQNPLHIKLWETLGASPTPISFSELYTALQQKTVDAQDNPLELTISQRFYEVQNSVTLTNHMFQVGMATANLDWYNSLTADQQKIVDGAIHTAVEFQRNKAAEDNDAYIKTLKDAGLEVIELTDKERKAFEDKMDPVIAEVSNEVGGDLVKEIQEAVKAEK